MKKLIKISCLLMILLFTFYNTCFADVVYTSEQAKHHGMRYIDDPGSPPETLPEPEPNILAYVFIGLLILVIIVCVVIIINGIMDKKKEKENNNDNNNGSN